MIRIDLNKLVGAPALAVMMALGAVATLAPVQHVAAQVRGLPDFTDLVEQVGPSVVNIRTVERARAGGAQGGQMRSEEHTSELQSH